MYTFFNMKKNLKNPKSQRYFFQKTGTPKTVLYNFFLKIYGDKCVFLSCFSPGKFEKCEKNGDKCEVTFLNS